MLGIRSAVSTVSSADRHGTADEDGAKLMIWNQHIASKEIFRLTLPRSCLLSHSLISCILNPIFI